MTMQPYVEYDDEADIRYEQKRDDALTDPDPLRVLQVPSGKEIVRTDKEDGSELVVGLGSVAFQIHLHYAYMPDAMDRFVEGNLRVQSPVAYYDLRDKGAK